MKKKVVILTGAGISAESGISTFRDSDGLWEQYRVEDVATHDAYLRNPELVLNFYNERRRQLFHVRPNEGHRQLVRLEEKYDVRIITDAGDVGRTRFSGALETRLSVEQALDIVSRQTGMEWSKLDNVYFVTKR